MDSRKIFLLGATGTIGRATAQALVDSGHQVTAFVRDRTGPGKHAATPASGSPVEGLDLRVGRPSDLWSLEHEGFRGQSFDVLVSCLASRTGAPRDAWAIDHQAHLDALTVARRHGVQHMVLLSAICVQKPLLEFQRAKLAFEAALIGSGLVYTIVRPTAFFKSLSGQFERVRQGKPFLLFGDGTLTRCKPISDRDLGAFIAQCVVDANRHNKILSIGGPGPAITPLDQGLKLFELLGREPRFRRVPVAVLDAVIAALSLAGRVSQAAADKAELARIGRYYATESMLSLNPDTGAYDDARTPSAGHDTLFDHYAAMVRGEAQPDRGDHAVF